ncbi:alpha/beta hydrolase [Streptomyces gobiensis]|uniref:alpha/beta hydrolase n=1 Tax=Streptomyces gobiensis TaxID=2875706 RepID=UPI001E3D0E1D|nr:alpha/beta hydrolase [Streptomyces gobiensis]UGY91192.1 alpha/beta hydrolase family protein [Streptomyces gobiensis]
MRRFKRGLVTGTLAVAVIAGTGGWGAGTQQEAVTGPPPGSAAWRADVSLGRGLPDPARASPKQVAAFFAGLSGAQRQSLAERHPMVVGNLDGAPVRLRYRANARSYAEHYGRALEPGRQLLAFDPRGRGQLVEVYGDVEHAERTAVFVPGSDNDLAGHRTATEAAGNLRRRMVRDAPGVRTATVAWVGYTTPVGVGIDAATSRLAEAGAPRLERFLQGLAATTGAAAPSVFCHSYGSVVCGALGGGADLSGMVFLGSPGAGVKDVKGLKTKARVWAAAVNDSDWIDSVPHVQVLGLGHGTSPADPEFGARVVTADRAEGHAGYFKPGTDSLANFSAIALGRDR